jgi:LacI family transcriptional regulator
MTTIVDVARRAGVSIGTVSNVVRGTARVSSHLRERVVAAIRDLEYYPNGIASSLRIKQTCMLGMVLPDITNPFFPAIIRGAEDKAFERGYLLVTANTDEQLEREQRVVSALRSRRVDGILLASAAGTDNRHIQSAMDSGIAVVCLDRAVGVKTDAVLLDNVRGASKCVGHLIRSGFPSIAIITGPLGVDTARERLQGFEKAHEDAEMEVPRGLIFEGDFREESGYRLGKQILKQQRRPSAIFVCNGVMTLGVLRAFAELNVRCPEDVALATFDDLAGDSYFHPRLTVVVQPGSEIGAKAASLLIDRVEGKLAGDPVLIRIAPKLVVRESTQRAQSK